MKDIELQLVREIRRHAEAILVLESAMWTENKHAIPSIVDRSVLAMWRRALELGETPPSDTTADEIQAGLIPTGWPVARCENCGREITRAPGDVRWMDADDIPNSLVFCDENETRHAPTPVVKVTA